METLNQLQIILFLFWFLGGLCVIIFFIRKARNNEPNISEYYKLISQLDDQKEEDLNLIHKRNKEIDKIEKQILDCKKELGIELFKGNSAKEDSMKKKKIISYVILFIGLLPFVYVLCIGIYNSFSGYSRLCLFECELDYGLSAFIDSIIITSYLFWPLYLIGLIFIILSFFKFKYDKKINKYKDLL